MANLELSIGLLSNTRSRPILDGKVRADGINFNISSPKAGGEIFWRQLHFKDFDIAEMSFSDTLMQVSRGDTSFVMLPVFMTRQFFHTGTLVTVKSGIERPEDLRGKRVGLQEYVQTAHVWSRGVFKEEFGVDPNEIHWYQERPESVGHCHYFGLKPPPRHFQYLPLEKTVGEMMLSGELDAVFHYNGRPNMLDRSSANLRGHPSIRPLFAKPRAEQARYFQKTGIFPMNHAPVIRRSIVEKHPWVVFNLFQAFVEAKKQALAAANEIADLQASLGIMTPEARSAFNHDPLPYGLEANRKVLETCIRYSYEQGLSPRIVALEEIFPEVAMHL